MALARTDIGGYSSAPAHGTASFSTSSFTPPANSLLLVAVHFIGNNLAVDLGIPTISGGSLTYTREMALDCTLTASWATKMVVFRAPVGASPAAMTITVDDDNNQNIYAWQVSVVAFTGHDAAAPTAGQVRSATTNIGDGAHTLTLAAAPTADDVTLYWLGLDVTSSPANPVLAAGWTKDQDFGGGAGADAGAVVLSRRGNSTSTAVSVTDVYTAGGTYYKGAMAALVVKASAVDATPPVVNLTSASTFKMSDEPGKDAYAYAFSTDEDCAAWKMKVVDSDSDPHTAGEQVESGGAISSGVPVEGSITRVELETALALPETPNTAVNFRGINNPDYATGVTSIVVDKPVDTADGDVILAQIELWHATPASVTVAPPAGWTAVPSSDTTGSGGTHRTILYTKIASAEGASWTWTFSTTVDARESAISFFGSDESEPVEAIAVSTPATASTEITFPDVTTISWNARVLCWASRQGTNTGAFYGAVSWPGSERRDDDGVLLADLAGGSDAPGPYSIPAITGNAAADTYTLYTVSIREPQPEIRPYRAGTLLLGVVGRDLGSQQLAAVAQLGNGLNRQGFDLTDVVGGVTMDGDIDRAAASGSKLLCLFEYGGTYPAQAAAASWCADFAERYGLYGTFWENRGDPSSVHVTEIEIGNESSYSYNAGTYTDPETYANLVKAISQAVAVANPNVRILAQADEPGHGQNWNSRMFIAVPDLADHVDGWTIHAYGPPQDRMKKRMRDIDTNVAPHSSAPIWITEYGFATCEKSDTTVKTLSDNYGWPTNLSYVQAAAELENVLDYIYTRWATRAANPVWAVLYYQNTDQMARDDASTSREHYFGLTSWDVYGTWIEKGALFTAFRDAVLASPTTTRRVKVFAQDLAGNWST